MRRQREGRDAREAGCGGRRYLRPRREKGQPLKQRTALKRRFRRLWLRSGYTESEPPAQPSAGGRWVAVGEHHLNSLPEAAVTARERTRVRQQHVHGCTQHSSSHVLEELYRPAFARERRAGARPPPPGFF
jgi:hypothetical protein